jgi:hypothetical protein
MGRKIETHREQTHHNLSETFEYVVDPSDVPRNPALYHPWDHFVDGLQDPEVSKEFIKKIFEHGTVYLSEGNHRYRFLWTDDRSLRTYIMVVQLNPAAFDNDDTGSDHRHSLVTIYRWQHHRRDD